MSSINLCHQKLDKKALAQFLSVSRSIMRDPDFFANVGLKQADRFYSWYGIFRGVLRTEGGLLEDHLDSLKKNYPGSSILKTVDSLQFKLTRPLLTFEEMALIMGKRADTLSKSIRESRTKLPFKTIHIGSRLRRYCWLEVALWAYEEIPLDLPATQFPMPCRRREKGLVSEPSNRSENGTAVTPDFAKKALFGGFSAR